MPAAPAQTEARSGPPLLQAKTLFSQEPSNDISAMLAMGAYGAFPKRFADVSPRYLVPAYATVVAPGSAAAPRLECDLRPLARVLAGLPPVGITDLNSRTRV